MASQAFKGLNVQEFPLFGDRAAVSIPVKASLVCRAMDIPALPKIKIFHHSSSRNEEGSLILGLAWAIGLEAAAAFAILGIWNFLHLLR